jgi:hypothetical protein
MNMVIPTREQLVKVIRSHGLFRRESEAAADAVMALLSIADASELYADDPGVIIAGLLDGADHASCSSCRKVMVSARLLIERLLTTSIERGKTL